MPKSNIVAALNKLNTGDVFSMIFFALYKLKDIPEYSTLSELSYVLDGDNLYHFLEYYGGTTITIPTTSELKLVLNALVLYNYINLEGLSFEKALKYVDQKAFKLKDIKDCYVKICEILSKYDFSRNK